MIRKILLLAVLGALLALPATSEAASTSAQLKSLRKAVTKLQHDLKVVSQREKDDRAALLRLTGCLVTVPIAQYGVEGDAAMPGYLFGIPGAEVFATTGIDVDMTNPDAFQMLGLDCSQNASASGRAFHQVTLPRGVR